MEKSKWLWGIWAFCWAAVIGAVFALPANGQYLGNASFYCSASGCFAPGAVFSGNTINAVTVNTNTLNSNNENTQRLSIGGSGYITGDVNVINLPASTVLGTNGFPAAGGASDLDSNTQNVYIGIPDPNAFLAGPYAVFIGIGEGYYQPPLGGANSDGQIAIGEYPNVSGRRAVGIGAYAAATATSATALGPLTVAAGVESVAIGQQSKAEGVASVAIGLNANATVNEAIAIGTTAQASGAAGVALGQNANANGIDSLACGMASSNAGFAFSSAFGTSATNTAAHQIMLGTSSENVVMPGTSNNVGTVTTGVWTGTAVGLGYIAQGGATSGQFLEWNGTTWAPVTGSGSTAYPLSMPNGTAVSDTANGTMYIQSSSGGLGTLLLGAAGATTGSLIQSTGSGNMSLLRGDGSNSAVVTASRFAGTTFTTSGLSLSGPNIYGNNGFTGAEGQIAFPGANTGTVTFTQATGTLTGAGFSFNGTVQGAQVLETSSSGATSVSASNSGGTYYSTANTAWTLPAPAAGLKYTFIVNGTSLTVTVASASTGSQSIFGTALTGGTRTAPITRGSITVECIDGTNWFITAMTGTWT